MRISNRMGLILVLSGTILVMNAQALGAQQTAAGPRTVVALWDSPASPANDPLKDFSFADPATLAPIAVASIPRYPNGIRLTLDLVNISAQKVKGGELKNALNIMVSSYKDAIVPKSKSPSEETKFDAGLVLWLSVEYFNYKGSVQYYDPSAKGWTQITPSGDAAKSEAGKVVVSSITIKNGYVVIVFKSWLSGDIYIACDG